MLDVIFVCYGNICRSPSAEIIFRDILRKNGCGNLVRVSSRATSDCVAGAHLYREAKKELARRGLGQYGENHKARKITMHEIQRSDFILIMDQYNWYGMQEITGGKYMDKVIKLRRFSKDFDGVTEDIDDPWYTREFDRAFDEIEAGCKGFFETVKPLIYSK